MPPEARCPFCTNIVPDWHFEWHSKQDQSEIFAGNKAMECPLCHAGVGFDGFVVTKLENRVVAVRDIGKAALWARNQNRSLHDYLQTDEGRPFASSWSEAQIESADRAAAQLE